MYLAITDIENESLSQCHLRNIISPNVCSVMTSNDLTLYLGVSLSAMLPRYSQFHNGFD